MPSVVNCPNKTRLFSSGKQLGLSGVLNIEASELTDPPKDQEEAAKELKFKSPVEDTGSVCVSPSVTQESHSSEGAIPKNIGLIPDCKSAPKASW